MGAQGNNKVVTIPTLLGGTNIAKWIVTIGGERHIIIAQYIKNSGGQLWIDGKIEKVWAFDKEPFAQFIVGEKDAIIREDSQFVWGLDGQRKMRLWVAGEEILPEE